MTRLWFLVERRASYGGNKNPASLGREKERSEGRNKTRHALSVASGKGGVPGLSRLLASLETKSEDSLNTGVHFLSLLG
jgi:hypothetical protein